MKLRGLLIIILIGIVAPLSLITVLSESNTNSETIAIIGTGNVGSTLGKIWAAKGHEIIYGSRTPTSDRVQQLVRESGKNAMSTTQADAARRADIVMIPIPPTAIPEVIDALGNLEGKLIIDTTNWWDFEDSWAISPHDPRDSLAEQVPVVGLKTWEIFREGQKDKSITIAESPSDAVEKAMNMLNESNLVKK